MEAMTEAVVPGSHKRFYMITVLPCIGGCVLLLGIFLCGSAIAVLAIEKDHAAVSTVPFQSAPIVLLMAGILAIAAGIFMIVVTKCINVTQENVKKTSRIFMWVLVVACILAFVSAIMGFVYVRKVENTMEDDMKIQVKQYGVTGSYESLININRIQSKNKCCGVINYVDWRNTTYGGRRYDKVPDSCCIEENHACGFGFVLGNINHRGCLNIVKRSTSRHLMLVGVGGLLVSLIELALVIAVCFIRKKKLN